MIKLTRRSFFGLLTASLFVRPNSTKPIPIIFKPHPKQIEFLNSTSPVGLYGIPYHHSDATTSRWLGIERK